MNEDDIRLAAVMQFIVLFFAAALLALAACAKVELQDNYTPKPIVFNSPAVGNPTKAIIDGTNYPTGTNFDVWALYYEGTTTGPSNAQSADYKAEYFSEKAFASTTVSESTFWHSTGIFWPKNPNAKLTFHAFSPATLGSGILTHTWTEIATNKTGFVLTDYEVDQTDLLYSDYAYDKVRTDEDLNHADPAVTTGYTGIDINFHHALAVVRFEIKLENAVGSTATYHFTSLDFYGEDTKGTFKENVVYDGLWNAAHTPTWEVAASPVKRTVENKLSTVVNAGEEIKFPAAAVSYTDYNEYNSVKGESLTEEQYNALPAEQKIKTPAVLPLKLYQTSSTYDGQFIVMPQSSVTTNAKIVVNYTETIGVGTARPITTGEIALTGIDTWQVGKRYTYTITIGFNEIRLDPAVGKWVDEDISVTPSI